ncbi:MAG TPA: alpha/beta fold hydrolase [Xanthomonadales bacterium]|nr:alpha/beta fold hydrolase [Xanthomonadales bacterium]
MSNKFGAWALALCGLVANAAGAATEPATDPCMARTETILKALDAGEFEQARVDFDATMQANLSAEQLGAVWASLPQQVGARLAVAEGRTQAANGAIVAIIPLQHAKAWLELQVSCNAAGKVSGLYVRPAAAPTAKAPTVEESALWSERELAVESAGLSLPGTLTLPKGEVRAGAVLVHGSGAHDRDEAIGPNRVFRDLAHGLAERGIAVLRYEKRSHAHPESFAGKAFTVKEEVTDDALAAVKLLGLQAELKDRPLYVIGHSLGALLAPRIASGQPEIAGVVMLAAPARTLTEMIPKQTHYIANLDGEVSTEERAGLKQIQKLVDEIEALTPADADETALLLGAPAAYWLDLKGYRPFLQARALGKPILLLQGERDYQVTMAADFLPWHQRMHEIEGFSDRSFAGLNHLFMPAGDPPGPTDYEKPGHVDAKVIAAIGDWIVAQGS